MRWEWLLPGLLLGAVVAGTVPARAADPSAPAAQDKLDAAVVARAIDRAIQQRLDEARIEASAPADDAEFLRRVYLDLHGVIPPAAQVAAFLDSREADKRARVIDDLLASPRYGESQAEMWTSILYRIILEGRYSPPKEPLARWLEEAINTNMPWDRQAFELITASGNVARNGTVAYLVHTKGVRPLEEVTNLTARVFLGRADIKCAQCHDHPFISLTNADYWGVAAFFSQVEVVRDNTSTGFKNANLGLDDRLGPPPPRKAGEMPDGFLEVPPRLLDDSPLNLDDSVPYRRVLAEWVTSPRNPFFAKAMVNRTWAHFFGRGLVNPIDEMNEDNAATHPELLDLLADEFVASGFDRKHLVRSICNSQTYQRSSRTTAGNSSDTELYSHMPVKVLSPRQLFDSLERMQGRDAPLSDRARQSARDQFIASFGLLESTDGELPDPSEYDRNLAQQLRMMTANPPFHTLPGQLVRELAPADSSQQPAIELFYLRILSRRPSPQELDRATAYVQGRGSDGYLELARVLLTTSEFALNH